jgi:hypothetical protein
MPSEPAHLRAPVALLLPLEAQPLSPALQARLESSLVLPVSLEP